MLAAARDGAGGGAEMDMYFPEATLARLLGSLPGLVPEADHAFAARVYGGDFGRYIRRLEQYGMRNRLRVLDAGAGFGQWTIALASVNAHVSAVEMDPRRASFVTAISKSLGMENVDVREGSIAATDFADERFDAIFCYGVLEQTPWKSVLAEFARLLAPSGLVYVNANDIGWYDFLQDTQHNRAEGYDPAAYAARAGSNTRVYETTGIAVPPLIITPDALAAEAMRHGLTVISAGPEGTAVGQGCTLSGDKPFFAGVYGGRTGVHEMLAKGKGSAGQSVQGREGADRAGR